MTEQDFKSIFDMAESYCKRHQIIYCDHHKKLIKLVIEKTLEKVKDSLQIKQNTVYDMDIYRDMIPNARIDYNKREKEID